MNQQPWFKLPSFRKKLISKTFVFGVQQEKLMLYSVCTKKARQFGMISLNLKIRKSAPQELFKKFIKLTSSANITITCIRFSEAWNYKTKQYCYWLAYMKVCSTTISIASVFWQSQRNTNNFLRDVGMKGSKWA